MQIVTGCFDAVDPKKCGRPRWSKTLRLPSLYEARKHVIAEETRGNLRHGSIL